MADKNKITFRPDENTLDYLEALRAVWKLLEQVDRLIGPNLSNYV
jgi:hypothetical protein